MDSLRGWIIGILLFAGVMTGSFMFLSNVATNYADYTEDLEGNYTEFYEKMQGEIYALNETASDIQSKTQESKVEESPVGFYTIVKSLWNAVKMVFGTIDTMAYMITHTSEFLQLPNWFFPMILAIILTLLAFIVISAGLKWRV